MFFLRSKPFQSCKLFCSGFNHVSKAEKISRHQFAFDCAGHAHLLLRVQQRQMESDRRRNVRAVRQSSVVAHLLVDSCGRFILCPFARPDTLRQ